LCCIKLTDGAQNINSKGRESVNIDDGQDRHEEDHGIRHRAALAIQFRAASHGHQPARPHKDAYLDDAGAITYGVLDDAMRKVAAALLDLGLHREERVLVCLHDTIDFPLVFLGALYAGVVPVCANTLLTVDDYAFMLEHSRAQALVVSGPLVPTLVQAMERAAHEVRSIVVSRPGAGLAQGIARIHARGASAPNRWTASAPTSPDSIAFWLYSSGSTGRPKGTVHTHANLCARKRRTAAACSIFARATSRSPPRSCSSRTGSATRSRFRCPSARRSC
jgi:acyl-CoA synthetase (AMP-forming)/AMP-acid ligase II